MDWKDIFLGDLDGASLTEILMRTFIMFLCVLVLLRMTGKKGVRQLSIFEVAIIISLGSAAGDPMLAGDFAVLPSLLVFAIILGLYRLITWLAAKFPRFESVVEGDPMYVIEDGKFVLMDEAAHTFAQDEFFAELRALNIEHVGQVKTGVLETNGQLSVLYYSADEVRPGLPIWPKLFATKSKTIADPGEYACTRCGEVQFLDEGTARCPRCSKDEWVRAIDVRREP